MRIFLTQLIHSLFPPICPLCRQKALDKQGEFCTECLATFNFITPPFCTRCGIPFPSAEDGIPHRCQSCLNPSLLDFRIRSAGYFSGGLRKAILNFKYQKDVPTGNSLAQLLVRRFPLLYPVHEYDFIIPVPLHPRRLREREFNQSILLANPLAKILRLPVDLTSVQRIRDTKPQSMLGEKERRKNIKDAYAVVHPLRIRKRHILIVDDVCTTGATLESLARLLLEHGATKVDTITVARAG